MSFSLGIVGLPNVGKSTLFNALTRSKQANVQNYPFCTIDPNVGVVEVPDERLAKLAAVSQSKKIIPTTIEFVDIAGLVKGASTGEGLGNKFLSHIREADAIVQVVRAFSDPEVIHVHNRVDPADDAAIVNTELALADLETVKKRLEAVKAKMKSLPRLAAGKAGGSSKELEGQLAFLTRLFNTLQAAHPARALECSADERKLLKELQLLTAKPLLYVVNVDESEISPQPSLLRKGGGDAPPLPQWRGQGEDSPFISISAKLEAELADLSPDEAKQYLHEMGIEQTGLDKLIVAGYQLLNLVTYFTSGEPETRAWTVAKGTKAPEAAGVIHSDFIKGFVKADVVNWQDFVELGGWSKLRETGKMRLEGKEYVVQDGDVCYFHIAS